MKFSVCNEMFEKWEWEDICRIAAEIGWDGIEVAPFTLAESVTDIPQERRRELRLTADRYGLEIVGLHWLLVSPKGLYINHPDPELQKKTLDYFRALIDFCADLGGKIMVVGSPKQRNVVEGITYQEAWDLAKRHFRNCLDLAEQRGVTICPEALTTAETNFMTCAAESSRMVKEINHPNMKLMLDVKAMASEDHPISDVIRQHGDLLVHLHANDANLRAPGFGDTDFVPIFEALKDTNFRGYVSIEPFNYEPDPVTLARESLKYLKEALSKA